MRVNVVTEQADKAWILRRMSEELAELPDVTIDQPTDAEAHYFINYALFNRKLPGIKIAYFTHLEEQGIYRQRFLDVMDLCDVAVLMNHGLLSHVPQGKEFSIIHPGTELKRPITFGVVGRTYPTCRKGEQRVGAMVASGFQVKAWGRGWPCPCESGDRREFYESIDYLVITSSNEGGPVPVLEAIGMGVPVIAPDVGFCWEYPVIRYDGWDSLYETLSKLARPRTWENWRSDHQELFERIGLCESTLPAA